MRASLLDEVKIIDTDTHVVEPPDLWVSRVSTRHSLIAMVCAVTAAW